MNAWDGRGVERCRTRSAALPALLAALSLVACSSSSGTAPAAVTEVPATPPSIAELPGIWGVSVRTAGEAASPTAPLTGGEAVKGGASSGAVASIAAGGGAGMLTAGILLPVTFAAGVVLAPATALVGAIYGAAASAEPEEVAAAQANMTRALDEREPAATLGGSVIAESEARAGRRLVDCATAATPGACVLPDGSTPDVLLSLTLGEPYFEVRGKIQPRLRLLQALDAAISVPGEVDPVYRRSWLFRGTEHGYFEFAADDGRVLRDELGAAREALVSKAVMDIFMPSLGERHATNTQPEGSVWTVIPPAVRVRDDDVLIYTIQPMNAPARER